MAIQRPYANPADLVLLWAIRAGLLALLVTPLIVTPSTIFPFIVGKALFARTVIEIVLALWLVLLIRRPEYRPVASTLAVLFGLFLLAALISGLFGVSPQRSIWSNYERMTGVYDLAHWFAALMIMMTVIKGALQWRIYLSALMGMAIFIGILGILEANQGTWSAFTWLRGESVSRLEISLGNATYVGAFGMVTTLIAFGLFADLFWRPKRVPEQVAQEPRRGGRRRRRAAAYGAQSDLDIGRLALAAFYLGAAAAGAFIMFGSGSRGAFFGFALGFGLAGTAYAIWGTERWLRVASRAGIVLLIGLVIIFLTLRGSALKGLSGIAPIFDRTVGESAPGRERDRSATSREIGSRAALEAFTDRPIVGWGYENFATVWNRNIDRGDFTGPFPEFDLAHNKPVEILATTGILGFLPYAGFWLWVLWLGIRKVRAKTETQMIDLFVTAGIMAFLGHLLFLFDTTSTFLLLIMMMAFAASSEARVAARAREHMPGDHLAPQSAVPAPFQAGGGGRRRRSARAADSGSGGESWGDIWAGAVAPTIIATVLILSLFFTQLQPWRAARAVLERGTPDELIANLGIFTQLSTITRSQFLNAVANQLSDVESLAARDAIANAAEGEAITAIDDEPENLKLRLVVADFYRSAADAIPDRRAEFMQKAREQTDEASMIGPHIFESMQNEVEQAFAEGDLATIELAIARWKDAGWTIGRDQLFDARLEKAQAAAQ